MAEDNKLLIEIEASTVNAVRALDNLNASLKDFGKEGTVSLASIENALKQVKKAASQATNIEDVRRFGEEYRKLRLEADKIQGAFNGVGDSAKRARVSVYALNQVVRDLPFGFIAISNNIPVLTDQLQQLYRENNNKVIPTLKAFASGLTGAAGVGIAISAVTSLITSAVQRYGSLSNAIEALTSSYGPLLERLQKSNSQFEKFTSEANNLEALRIKASQAIEQEAQDINVLVGALKSENATRGEKEIIISRIQSANSGLFKDYVIETESVDKLTQALIIYNGVLTAQEEAKAFREEIGNNSKFIFEQTKLLKDLGQQLGAAKARYDKALQSAKNFGSTVGPGGISSQVAELKNAEANLKKLQVEYQNLTNKVAGLYQINKELRQAVDDGLLSEIQATAKLNKFLQDNFKTKKDISAAAKGQNAAENAAEKAAEDAIKRQQELLRLEIQGYKDRIKNLDRYSTNAIEIFQKLEEKEFELAKIDTEKLFNGKELEKAIELLKANVFEKYRAAYKEFLDNKNELIKKEKELNDKQLDELNKYIDATTNAYNKLDFGGVERRNKEFFKNLAKENEIAQDAIDKQKKAQQELANVFAQALGRGIDNFVEGIADGKKGADALKESFKQIGEELKKIIIKLAIIEGLKILANILAPGSGKAVGAVASKAFGVPDLTGLLGGGRGQTKGGINIGPGGLAIAGQVTFVQRGPDLVGVLAQANNRINRVG